MVFIRFSVLQVPENSKQQQVQLWRESNVFTSILMFLSANSFNPRSKDLHKPLCFILSSIHCANKMHHGSLWTLHIHTMACIVYLENVNIKCWCQPLEKRVLQEFMNQLLIQPTSNTEQWFLKISYTEQSWLLH